MEKRLEVMIESMFGRNQAPTNFTSFWDIDFYFVMDLRNSLLSSTIDTEIPDDSCTTKLWTVSMKGN